MNPGTDSPSDAVVLTFDNLGEATELERGTWPAGRPLGRHPSVRLALPRLLAALDTAGLSATFFVEAINCQLNPQALREISARGHELGMHGWRHETWAELPADQERELLERGTGAFAELGLPVAAFRPPGGELTERTAALLGELGYRWCSPVGGRATVDERLALVPFEWELVDAYYLMESFAQLRGGGPPLPAGEVADRMTDALLGGSGSPRTLILHPFLMVDEQWWVGTQRLLQTVAHLVGEGRVWAGPGGRFVDRLRGK
ncbi:MAG TPA: polysaccharide deacetylase family protein [Solirubrobacteraceae bacterium]